MAEGVALAQSTIHGITKLAGRRASRSQEKLIFSLFPLGLSSRAIQ